MTANTDWKDETVQALKEGYEARLSALQTEVERRGETIRKLRDRCRTANALLTEAEGFIGYLADHVDAEDKEIILHANIKAYLDLPANVTATAPVEGEKGDDTK